MNNELPTIDNWRVATLFDTCRGISTNRPIFLQNKPNFRKAQMNVSANITKDYENICNPTLGQNKPKQSQFARRAELMQSLYLQRIMKKNAAKGYEKTKPKQTQFLRG